jgi:hypothetical protein
MFIPLQDGLLMTNNRLDQLANRLTKILSETRKLNPAE